MSEESFAAVCGASQSSISFSVERDENCLRCVRLRKPILVRRLALFA